MYLPINPHKLNDYWDILKNSLRKQKLVYLILNGKYSGANLCIEADFEINKLMDRLKIYNYVRLGSQHMLPTPPHFAIDITSETTGHLKEFITSDISLDSIKREISLATQFIFFELPNLNEIIIPFIIKFDPDSYIQAVLDEKNNQTKIYREKNRN
jgi:hypothetical protein